MGKLKELTLEAVRKMKHGTKIGYFSEGAREERLLKNQPMSGLVASSSWGFMPLNETTQKEYGYVMYQVYEGHLSDAELYKELKMRVKTFKKA